MAVTRDHEIWAMALWVEKHHEIEGDDFIADRIASLEANGEQAGAALWLQVQKRYSQLRTGVIPIHGQPGIQPN
ncbi:MAG: hypothetical protein HC774_02265 [Sphingomonadales bacterium]|nr:hypothetical protein [Sphingomonadales bacterium]